VLFSHWLGAGGTFCQESIVLDELVRIKDNRQQRGALGVSA
jgi:hypothetical protein